MHASVGCLDIMVRLTKISSAKATPSPLVVTALLGAEPSEGSRKGFFDIAGNP